MNVVRAEEERFFETLATGTERLVEKVEELRKKGSKTLPGEEAFTLYDTYGFPVELSTEEARKSGIAISADWRAEFDAKMAEQRARSQGASKMHP